MQWNHIRWQWQFAWIYTMFFCVPSHAQTLAPAEPKASPAVSSRPARLMPTKRKVIRRRVVRRPQPAEQVVSLDDLEAKDDQARAAQSRPGPPAKTSGRPAPPSGGGRPGMPLTGGRPGGIGFPQFSGSGAEDPIRFKVYFDLNLYSRPGREDLTFDNFHAFLFLEGAPMPNMQFSFDVSPSPRFFELDWQIHPSLQLRLGKIWIPYDDTPIHNIYGGRINVSRLQLGAAFLPDIWTDLGVGVKWTVADVKDLRLVADAYVVNGFHAGGVDPVNNTNPYPSFSDLSTGADNNGDKAVGGRVHALFWNRIGLGGTVYSGRWSNQAAENKRLLIFGGDFQFRFPPTMSELRLGILGMKAGVTDADIYRAGTYLELGQYLTRNRAWKVMARAGTLQMDDRVEDVNDQRIVGLMLIYRPNVLQFSLEHSRDLQKVVGKSYYTFTNLRMAIMF